MQKSKVFGIAGWSGSGKTTLIERLLPRLRTHGLAVSVLKHTHHDFDIDKPGKDSWRFREAGAGEVLLAGDRRWAMLCEAPRPPLADLLARFAPCDLILVEGYKSAGLPKLEVHRPSLGKPLLHPEVPGVLAVASDAYVALDLPRLDLNDDAAVTAWLLRTLDF